MNIDSPYRPTMARTMVKTATYKFCTFLAVLVYTYMRTRDTSVALSIGGTDLVVKTIIYIIHERVWAHINTPEV